MGKIHNRLWAELTAFSNLWRAAKKTASRAHRISGDPSPVPFPSGRGTRKKKFHPNKESPLPTGRGTGGRSGVRAKQRRCPLRPTALMLGKCNAPLRCIALGKKSAPHARCPAPKANHAQDKFKNRWEKFTNAFGQN